MRKELEPSIEEFPCMTYFPLPRAGIAAEKIDTADNLQLIDHAFKDLSGDALSVLKDKVSKSFTGPMGTNRVVLLNSLFQSDGSKSFLDTFRAAGMQLEQLGALLDDEGMITLVSTMAKQWQKYNFQLGIIFSQVTLATFPEEVTEALQPHAIKQQVQLSTIHKDWYICEAGEENLTQAIEDTATVSIHEDGEPLFLLKERGKSSAVCLKNIVTPDGKVFVAGNWYSPTDAHSREQMHNAFDSGHASIDLFDGSWAMMREVRPEQEKDANALVSLARSTANSHPDFYSSEYICVDGMPYTRKGYRKAFRERQVGNVGNQMWYDPQS